MLKQHSFIQNQSPSSFTQDFQAQSKSFSLKISPHCPLQSLQTSIQNNFEFQDIQQQCSVLQQKPQTPAVQVIKVKNSNVNNLNNHHYDDDVNANAQNQNFQSRNITQISFHSQGNLNNNVKNGKIYFQQAQTDDGKSSQCKSQLQSSLKNSNGKEHYSHHNEEKLWEREQNNCNLKDLVKQNILSQKQQNEKGMVPFSKKNKIAQSRYSEQNINKHGIEKFHQRKSEQTKQIILNKNDQKQQSNQESLNNQNILERQAKAPKKVNQLIYACSVERFIGSPIKQGYMMETLIIIQNGLLGFGTKYYLKQKYDNKILCSAKKQIMSINSQFVLSLGNSHFSKRDSEFIGVLEGNFGGKQWNLNCPIIPAKFNQGESCSDLRTIMTLECSSEFLNSNSFLKMTAAIKDPQAQQNRRKNKEITGSLKIKSEMPHYQKGRFSLDFKGIAKMPSKKNFILQTEAGERCLMFGKQQQNVFQMNIRYPLSVVEGFSLCLATLNEKAFIF